MYAPTDEAGYTVTLRNNAVSKHTTCYVRTGEETDYRSDDVDDDDSEQTIVQVGDLVEVGVSGPENTWSTLVSMCN